MRLDARRSLALVLLSCALLTLAGYLLKAQCIGAYNELRDSHLCSNDIQVLYSGRGLVDKQFPYVEGGLVDGQIVGGTLEYPVLTGIAAWLPALFVADDGAYLAATALLLAPFSLLTAWLLHRMAGWRALAYAAAPPLVWYSFHNWDLLVVAATVAAFAAWHRGRWGGAGALLGIGASLKLWPGFFLAPLVLHRLRAGDRRGALLAGGAGVGSWAAVNVPFLVVNPAGWWAPYAFQKLRAADVTSNSIWHWGMPGLTLDQLNQLIPVLLGLSFVGALAWGWHRSRGAGGYPFLQVSAAMLCAFLLLNKAHSPQFALWLLPFFALVHIRLGWVLGYLALDTLFYVGLFRWFYDLSQGRDFGLAKQAVVLGVWGRAALLVLLFGLFLRAAAVARPAEQPSPAPSHGPSPSPSHGPNRGPSPSHGP
ncbi:MAG: glycosyltransferase 87 family protein [Mycobacteriales bacterium]